MKYPKISIVTPSYNQAEFLEYTICSVLNQNYPNLEYIIIDGGSTDGSVEIIKKYADRLTYWVSERDNGQYEAINKGFSYTTGDIMSWINSSDIYYPWTFNVIAEIFENNKEVRWIHGIPTNLGSGNAPQSIYFSPEKNKYDILSGNYRGIQQESVFWKRDLWNKIGSRLDTTVKYAGDLYLWLCFFKYEHLYYVNTILGGFRIHDERRGGDNKSIYGKEVQAVLKKYKLKLSFSEKLRIFFIKIFIGKSRLLSKMFKKIKIISWYRRHVIYYDYENNNWIAGDM